MSKFEQFLKPPSNMNSEEEMYKESQEGEEEMNNYNQNDENSYDNGNENQNIEDENNINDVNDINNEGLQNSKNKFQKNFENEEENSEIIQGINSINNIRQKHINQNLNQDQNEYNIKENNNYNNENIEENYMNMNLNDNSNTPYTTSPNDIMSELLFKIRKLKGNRTMQKSDITNSNELNMNNDLGTLQRTIKNDKIKMHKNEYIGKLNINNQIIQNNPKMKEIAYLIKDYNQDKNNDNNIQLNFYNNNQINIIKPDVFFNMGNQRRQNNEEYNTDNSINQNKHYISIIDGKAIVNGQRINVNSGFQTSLNSNFIDRKINFGDFNFNNNKNRSKNLFNFGNERRSLFEDNKNNLDFKLQNMKKKYNFNNIENSKNNYKKSFKNNFFTKEFYNEELDKMNDNLFNMSNERFKIRK